MKTICSKEKCTGCTACMNSCSHGAISMRPDDCGFTYPVINQDACVDCGLCVKVCPANNPLELISPSDCYAVTVKEEKELLSCSSGGAATAISKYIIQQGGVVYGCSGTNPRFVHHVRVDNLSGLNDLKGSKYVQSHLGTVFQAIKKDLKDSRLVLFIGTPCQVAGLRNYLHQDYANLYTIDLVCHGVPSQKMLNDNLKRYCSNDENIYVSFRRKNLQSKPPRIEFGWEIKSKNGERSKFRPYNKDYYMFGFLRCLTFRENCYSCPYAQKKRIGDMTLCDFWGLQQDAGFEMGKGVSAVLVNTAKGDDLLSQVKGYVRWKKRTVSEAIRWNNQLNYPCNKPQNYSLFIHLYGKRKFNQALIRAYFGNYLYDYYLTYKNRLKVMLYRHRQLKKM